MNILFSIKPKYVKHIKEGTKKFEFRRRIFKKEIENVIVYSSAPDQLIAGYFKYSGFLQGTPLEIWSKCKNYAEISEVDFFEYFKDSSIAFAIKIDDFICLDTKHRPQDVVDGFVPPQSFRYIEDLDSFLQKVI